MTYLLPTAPITTESEALRAGRASAIAIFIGVVVGIIGVIWTLTHPEILQQAIANAEAKVPGAGAVAQSAANFGQYFSYAVIVIQLVLGFVQWRSPNKVIAYIFLALILLGFLTTAAAPLLAGLAPDTPTVPIWQILLSLIVMAVQFVLHITGLKGIGKLDQLQLASAR
jgi:amino acid transporter